MKVYKILEDVIKGQVKFRGGNVFYNIMLGTRALLSVAFKYLLIANRLVFRARSRYKSFIELCRTS